MMPIPHSDIDLFADNVLCNSNDYYRTLRSIGPIVYLPANDLYAVTQYDAVKAALRSPDALISGKGVAANTFINDKPPPNVLMSDGDAHRRRRAALAKPLMPGSLAEVKITVAAQADSLIVDLLSRDSFCVVKDFAAYLPLAVVANLIGLNERGRENMLVWASATFDVLGPMNARSEAAMPSLLEMVAYVGNLSPAHLRPEGWAARVLASGESGVLQSEEAGAIISGYVAPSLDTTILASAHMFWQLAANPEAFAALRADPSLIPSMVNESVRLASPIRGFTRYAETDFEFAGRVIPAGSRAAILYASANRDERQYPNPDNFDVHRDPRDQLGWGHGVHTCVGMHLARLEMEQLAMALVRHVRELKIGAPKFILNNILQGMSALPGSLVGV